MRYINTITITINSLENKETLSFICFHVCDFYPSINEKLLSKALDFASEYRPISRLEHDIILHAKCSLLFSKDSSWEKKSSNNLFNVTMGSFDGAETCKLVGYYLLSATCYRLPVIGPALLTEKYGQNIGVYCDDGLAPFDKTPQEIKKIKKELCKIFRQNDHGGTVKKHSLVQPTLQQECQNERRKVLPFSHLRIEKAIGRIKLEWT